MKAFRVFLFSWIVAQTFYFGIYGPDLIFLKQMRPHIVLFVLMVVSFVLAWAGGRTIRRQMDWPERLLLLLSGLLAASFVLGGAAFDEMSKRWLGPLLNITLYPVTAYFVVRAFPYRKELLINVLKLVCILGLYCAFMGVFQHYAWLNWLVWPGYILDPQLGTHPDRARGPFMEAVAMGRVLTMAFGCWLVLRLDCGPFLRRVSLIAIPVTMGSVYFTDTRGPWLGFALLCLTFLVFKTPVRRTVLWLAICIVVVASAGIANKFSLGDNNLFLERESTVTDRIVTWLVSGRMIEAHPVLGVGFGRFNDEWPDYYKQFKGFDFTGFDGSHNTWLSMAAETGLPTFGLYVS